MTDLSAGSPAHATSRPARGGASGVAAVAGGVLWAPFGVLELLEPLGPDTQHDAARGYDIVTDTSAFVAYNVPGSLALLLCGVGLLGLLRWLGVVSLPARVAATSATACGAFSAAGIAVHSDPVVTGGRTLGTLMLVAGALLAAGGASGRWRSGLLCLGVLGLLVLAVWPLVYAVELLPAVGGAAVLAVYGAGWAAAGARRCV
jgi:hypothetical protein